MICAYDIKAKQSKDV